MPREYADWALMMAPLLPLFSELFKEAPDVMWLCYCANVEVKLCVLAQ